MKKINIADKIMNNRAGCLVVAEAGSNHNGSLAQAKKLIAASCACGCSAVKFQAFKTEELVSRKAKKAPYQKKRSAASSQFQMLKALELSAGEHGALVKYAFSLGMPVFYSVFDRESADLVESLGIGIFKLGSGELTNIPLIKYIAGKNKPLILSCGMSTDSEVAAAVKAYRENSAAKLMLMHCSTGYPCALTDSHLRRINYLEKKFNSPCGFSDHSAGIIAGVAAAYLGAPLIEKHFTLDNNLPGPDHPMSMGPLQMRKLCSAIAARQGRPLEENSLGQALRDAGLEVGERLLEKILGSRQRKLSRREKNQRGWARKSIIAVKDIKAGAVLTENNLSVKRPEKGILPKDLQRVLGRRTCVMIKKETPVTWEMLV